MIFDDFWTFPLRGASAVRRQWVPPPPGEGRGVHADDLAVTSPGGVHVFRVFSHAEMDHSLRPLKDYFGQKS